MCLAQWFLALIEDEDHEAFKKLSKIPGAPWNTVCYNLVCSANIHPPLRPGGSVPPSLPSLRLGPHSLLWPVNVGGHGKATTWHALVQGRFLRCQDYPLCSHCPLAGPQSEPTWGSLSPTRTEELCPVGLQTQGTRINAYWACLVMQHSCGSG